MTFVSSPQSRLLVVLAGLLVLTAVIYELRTLPGRSFGAPTSKTAETTPHKEPTANQSACPPLPRRSNRIPTTWIASYPGSGATVTRQLLEATTGYIADDYHAPTRCLKHNVITCKTHWPFLQYNFTYPQSQTPSMLLFRNPLWAIPSYYNWLWERDHHVAYHTQQASVGDWILWRDAHFSENLDGWKSYFQAWTKVDQYICYEDLFQSENTGPHVLTNVLQVLSNITQQRWNNNTACLWRSVVLDQHKAKRPKHYRPRFTREQLEQLEQAVRDVAVQVPAVASEMRAYEEAIREAEEDGEEENGE